MDHKSRAAQCLVEHQIMQHVKAALRITLGWEVDAVGFARKLSSVKFTMQSFCRHLERIMGLEEDEGYMSIVAEMKPNLVSKAATLGHEHEEFRAELRRISPAMEATTANDQSQFDQLCRELSTLLDRIDLHDGKETDLLQEACCEVEGGEG